MVEPHRTADGLPLKAGAPRPDFVSVWIVVTGLWTVATILRMNRIWVPVLGWHGVFANVYTWISLLLPPLIFAVILLAVKRIAVADR